jgi:thiol-disulfide isomerase/thioredoxin
MVRALIASLAVLAACAAPESDESATPPAGAAETAVPADMPKARGFITKKEAAPEGARDIRGDGVLRDADERPFSHALLGERLPSLKVPLNSGRTMDLSVPGKWTVVDVWGIWCSDCMNDAPYADALSRAIAQDPDLAFVSVHVPASKTRITPQEMFGKYGSVESYMKEKGYIYPVVIDVDATKREALKIAWTPTYLLVSPDGVVRGFRTDLSVAEGEPVKDFMRDIARVRSEVKKAAMTERVPATIGPEGAMKLKGETPFTMEAMQTAFPGHEFISETIAGGIANYPVFHVVAPEKPSERLYTVEPDWTKGYVRTVSTLSASVKGPGGVQIGVLTLSEFRKGSTAMCEREVPQAPKVARFICQHADGRFDYIFSVPLTAVKPHKGAGLPNFTEEPQLDEMRYRPPHQAGAE